ncbi:putative AAA family ATPase [Seiridium cardinale]|uniref:AAA family ATPase n=1 Tax=Seiridium cardinale TaxID=138064 RepID=A0ABR2Y2I7_9PEZI
MAAPAPGTAGFESSNGTSSAAETQQNGANVEERITRIEADLQHKLVDLENRFRSLLSQQSSAAISPSEENKHPSNDKPAVVKLAEEKEEKDKSELTNDNEPPPRARVVIQAWSDEATAMKDRDFNPKKGLGNQTAGDQQPPKEATKQAFVLRKIVPRPDDDDPDYAELEITGPELSNILRKTIKSYTLHRLAEGSFRLIAPYRHIIHYWDALEHETRQQCDSKEEKVARSDLGLLLSQLKEWSGDISLDDYLKIRGDLVSTDNITFETLWTIFPPGTLVYSKSFLKQDQVFVVLDSWRTWPEAKPPNRRNDQRTWGLNCLTYDWNGSDFHRYSVTISIPEFEETKPIATLPVYPWKFVSNKAEMKERLLTRGNKFRKYCVSSAQSLMFKYNGPAVIDKKGFGFVTEKDDDERSYESHYFGRHRERQEPILRMSGYSVSHGQVMVDFASYYKYGLAEPRLGELVLDDEDLECGCNACQDNEDMKKALRTRYDFVRGAPDENWDEEQVMLCPPRLLGYILRDKMWAQLTVDGIAEIDKSGSETAFNSDLVLAEDSSGLDRKSILLGLVKSHSAPDGERCYQLKDIVEGKGQGLIILLYGPPGVGKTSTAETIAMATRKPLFSIGVSDVGTSAKYVESNLEKIFDLAQTWKAILLFDEADVFLQSRGSGQYGPTTERNALVSVFLRVLEYYRGVMILTTNQIAQFDVAVQSRINVAFKYDSLTSKQAVQIFKKFLKQYSDNKMVCMEEWDNINTWCERKLPKREFDGRQIRNVITSAVGIAASRDDKLRVSHLEEVVEIVSDFKQELSKQMDRYKQAQAMKD